MSAFGADGGDGSGAGQGAPEATPEAPPWLGPIQQRMDELSESGSRMAEQLAGLYQDNDEYSDDELDQLDEYGQFLREHGDELDEIAGGNDDGEYDGYDEPDVLDQLADRMDRAIERREAAANAETAIEDRDQAFEQLRETMPLLQHDETARALIERATRRAVRLCEQLGRDPSDLVDSPDFVNIIEAEALAHIGRQARGREREGSSDQREIVLESAAGAGAPSGKAGPDWGARIVAAAERLHPKI